MNNYRQHYLYKIFTIVFLFPFVVINSQTNNSAPYCIAPYTQTTCAFPGTSNSPGNTINHFIDGFVTSGALLNINNVASGCNGLSNNYIYYCSPRLVAMRDQVVTFSVQSGDDYDQSFGIFVDWNQNTLFDLPSEMIGGTLVPPTATSWYVTTFTVPNNQAFGKYRLRVRSYTVTPNALIDPCSPAQVGETEDYDFYVDNTIPQTLSAFVSANSPLCAGGNMNFILNHTGSSATSFTWSGPGNFSSNQQTPFFTAITPTMSGTYGVLVNDGACSTFKTLSVSISPLPTITVNSETVCSGVQTTLTASGASTYTWNTGHTVPSITLTPVATTTFVVSGQTNSCTSSQGSTITVVPTFTIAASTSATLICDGDSATITTGGANTYSWSHGPTTSVSVVSPSATTIYTVTGTIGPCNSQAFVTVHVENCSGLNNYFPAYLAPEVYPNPFSDELTISWQALKEISIYNLLGEKLIQSFADRALSIDTSKLPPGAYLIYLHGESYTPPIKIIKN